MSTTAWVIQNKADLYFCKGGFCQPDLLKARLFTAEEAAKVLRAFPDTVAIRVYVEEREPEKVAA